MDDINAVEINQIRQIKQLGAEGARQRFFINIVSNLFVFIAQVFINFWITPFLIRYLGIATYGLIPLSQTIISYGAVLTTSLNAALGRFLTIDIGNNDYESANTTFNTSLFFLLVLIGVLAPLFVIISLYFPDIFNVPSGWEKDSSWLSATIAISFFITIITSNFSVFPFIYSEFLKSNIINFSSMIIRTGLIIILFSIFPAHLWYFGIGNIAAGIFGLLGFILVWRILSPVVKIHPCGFDRSRLSSMIGMGGWLTINTLGALLLNRVDLIAINLFFAAAILGGYAAITQFSTFLDTLVTSLCTILRPILLIKYAQNDLEGLRKVTIQAIKLLGLILALIVGLLCGFSRPLISIWLGPSYQYLYVLFIVLTAHFSINLASRPLVFVQQAYNQVRWPGIITVVCGVINLSIDIVLGMSGKWGYMSIALSTALIWTFRNTIYTTIYTAHVMKLPWWIFLSSLKTCLVGTLLVGLASYGSTLIHMPDNWFTLCIAAIGITLPYGVIVWFFVLNLSEKHLLINLLPLRLLRISK